MIIILMLMMMMMIVMAMTQSIARILDPGNSRENQPDFFSLDHDFLFLVLVSKHEIEKRNSRSRLEARGGKKEILALVSKYETE